MLYIPAAILNMLPPGFTTSSVRTPSATPPVDHALIILSLIAFLRV
jgi:hypothetical protein